MTALNGLVGIDFDLAAIVVPTSLSSERAVLVHQFDDGHGVAQPASQPCPFASRRSPRTRVGHIGRRAQAYLRNLLRSGTAGAVSGVSGRHIGCLSESGVRTDGDPPSDNESPDQ